MNQVNLDSFGVSASNDYLGNSHATEKSDAVRAFRIEALAAQMLVDAKQKSLSLYLSDSLIYEGLSKADSSGGSIAPSWAMGFSNSHKTLGLEPGAHLSATSRGILIDLPSCGHYSGAGMVSTASVQGDFDAQVQFKTAHLAQGIAIEMAAICHDPDQQRPPKKIPLRTDDETYSVSLLYDVHGAPPYVSSECDESDGFRISWNHSFSMAASIPSGFTQDKDKPPTLSYNSMSMYNRYGKNAPAAYLDQWYCLRLIRLGDRFASYFSSDFGKTWVCSGMTEKSPMPPLIRIRLAAKHWPKEGSIAPVSRVWFRDFSLYAELAQKKSFVPPPALDPKNTALLPTELALLQTVSQCRSCTAEKAFWPKDEAGVLTHKYGRFGPVPMYASAPHSLNPDGKSPTTWFAKIEAGIPQPAVMKGCRKAPLMIMGINPNLKNDFLIPEIDKVLDETATDGARTVHPKLDDPKQYAKFYRYVKVQAHSAKMSLLDLENRLTSPIKSQGRSVLYGRKTVGERSFDCVIDLDRADNKTIDSLANQTWGADEAFVLLRNKAQDGQTIAGTLTENSLAYPQTNGDLAQLTTASEKYYSNAIAIAQRLGVVVGEDIAMHDIVACASSGWSDTLIPSDTKKTIIENCVQIHRHALKQVFQTRPKIIFFSGEAAMKMFMEAFPSTAILGNRVAPKTYKIDGSEQDNPDMLGWLREQSNASPENQLRIEMAYLDDLDRKHTWRCRLVPVDHFSYFDTTEHVHWDQKLHQEFHNKYPKIFDLLKVKKLLIEPMDDTDPGCGKKRNFNSGFYGIKLAGDDTLQSLTDMQDAAAESMVNQYRLNPLNLLAKLFKQEQISETPFAKFNARLERSQGGCSYCSSFESECDYEVKKSAISDEGIVQQLLDALDP